MEIVILTALGVGLATVFGSIVGFVLKEIPHRFNDLLLGFAAGIMMVAAILGLIVPAMEAGGAAQLPIVFLGIMCGAFCLVLADKALPFLHNIAGINGSDNRVMLLVLAIAIHNFPEGIAAGVSFLTDNTAGALSVAGGIALQNIPEGMVIIAPMLSAGITKKRAFLIALGTGVTEVLGTLIGYTVIQLSSAILPFSLAFAGGTMLYVICDEMIPETHSHGNARLSTYALLAGFCVMLLMDFLL